MRKARKTWQPRGRALLIAGMLIVPLAKSPATAAPEDFQARTTGEMVALCAMQPSDPSYVAAIHFCHGFALGAYRYYEALAAASPSHRYVCLPNPAPSRNEAIGAFVTWARASSERLSEPPVQSMFRYLAERYPCRQ